VPWMKRYIRLVRNLSNWWLHFGSKWGLTKADPLIFRTRNNVVVQVPKRLHHEFKEIFLEECYIRGLGVPVSENPVVLDVGANAGFFSLFAVSRFPGARVCSYEPIPANFRQLERNKDLNRGIGLRIYPKALYGYSGEMALSFDPGDSFTTSATVFEHAIKENQSIRVPCVSLSQALEENDLEHCDLLKMDCEGSEYSILYNAPSHAFPRIRQITMEVHQGTGPKENMGALMDFLKGQGFKCRRSGHMLWAWQGGRVFH